MTGTGGRWVPTALISWAHRNADWTDAQQEEWTATVVAFAGLLVRSGVDAELDLWHEHEPDIDWTRWGPRQVEAADFVLVAVSQGWQQRWNGTNCPRQGAGVVAEADALKGLFATDQAAFQRRTILILLPSAHTEDIPLDLHRLQRVQLAALDDASIEPLLRLLTGQPRYMKPPLGGLPQLPPVSGGQGSLTDHALNQAADGPSAPVNAKAVAAQLAQAQAELVALRGDDGTSLGEQRRAQLRGQIARDRGLLRGLGQPLPDLQDPDQSAPVELPGVPAREDSDERRAVLAHPLEVHGVVLAGPGTGKSSTVLELAARLSAEHPHSRVKVITFTRAATAELIDKIRDAGYVVDQPSTVHAFALSVLMRHAEASGLPQPLRIPDDWESSTLLYPDLARRLRIRGHRSATPRQVEELVEEMAAGWESMNPHRMLLTEVDPALRTTFRAAWEAHRGVFGYTLFAEMSFRAQGLLEDLPVAHLDDLALLIVDEYEDLNAADIAMIKAVAGRGIAVLAVGDDDQSVYSWRHAHPRGIREFAADPQFPAARSYTLSTSHRCGARILHVAREVIEISPTRPVKPPLHPAPGNPPGEVAYLRFSNDAQELDAVCRLIRWLVEVRQVPANQVVVLVRSDHNAAWSEPLRRQLGAMGLPVADVEQFRAPLETQEARRLLATARLMFGEDDLAWWTLLKLTAGIGETFVKAVADDALQAGERFATRLLRLPDDPLPAGTPANPRALRLTSQLLQRIANLRVQALEIAPPAPDDDHGWASWLLTVAAFAGLPVTEDLRQLLLNVGARTEPEGGLQRYLDSLAPVAQELALETPAVAILSMARSKGLTRTAVIVMGVEEGIIPTARPGADPEEERRLLYVAMTRARHYLFLTMARARRGRTAHTGGGRPGAGRTRCRFLVGTSLQPRDGWAYEGLASDGQDS